MSAGDLRPLTGQPVIVTGHSLGAARAAVMCGLMVADGAAPAARVVFGEPKPGLMDFAERIKDVPARSYRNGDALHHDLVTDVPFSFPPLQYVHPTPIVPDLGGANWRPVLAHGRVRLPPYRTL
ncbi:Lipase (class 3) [Bradyrhizobium erythrophlei]|nr:Lipase (class 3) [Bradyrhizobium erythrophlei]